MTAAPVGKGSRTKHSLATHVRKYLEVLECEIL